MPRGWNGMVGSSGYRGVKWDSHTGKWRGRVMVDGQTHCAGVFDDPKEASEACEALRADESSRIEEGRSRGYDPSQRPSVPVERSKNGKVKLTLPLLVDSVAWVMNVRQDYVLSRRRTAEVSEARQWVYYMMWRGGLTQERIGEKLGRERTSIIHGIKRSQERMETEYGRQTYQDIVRCLADPMMRECA